MASSPAYFVTVLLVSCPLILLTILGNSLLILTWVFQRSIRKPQYGYFLSLAVADFLVGTFVYPLTVSYVYNQQWDHGLLTCRAYVTMLFALSAITAWHLVAIAVDRYRTLIEGVTYVQRRSMLSIFGVAVSIWIAGFWAVLPIMLDWDHVAGDKTGTKQCGIKKLPHWVAHITCVLVVFPGILLVFLYWKIYKEIEKKLNKRFHNVNLQERSKETSLTDEDLDLESESNSRPMNEDLPKMTKKEIAQVKSAERIAREKRTAITLAIVTGAFLVCLTPWCLSAFYDMVVPFEWQTPYVLRYWLAILGVANSSMNPIIYAARIPEFQAAFRKMLKLQN